MTSISTESNDHDFRGRLGLDRPRRPERSAPPAGQYHDKPDISFVDFTSMVVMQDLGIVDVFTGDKHFKQVGLGFRLAP
jgi:predicted nucleic acid-binding protein